MRITYHEMNIYLDSCELEEILQESIPEERPFIDVLMDVVRQRKEYERCPNPDTVYIKYKGQNDWQINLGLDWMD